MAASYILAIDQGTTSAQAMLFQADLSVAPTSRCKFTPHIPASGHVEHGAEEIWGSVEATMCDDVVSRTLSRWAGAGGIGA